ncbi:hypothetical protein CWI42_020760 [Ordospora colligata]|uniref:Uncharacterized protein n=1 Tax=Ordospora colligata OC4 TaxID=1354746 RepID=A0A0B2UGT3_9MICR|nr:uncharacterized protein M896_020770 [Ordospora colligata OC4]KHN70241.1 hypothetical protein M896_020770 [Ordospora colligata OC4]TBU16785.1 hypothetical protein CWI41_020780 [Ordospora colligata]TBU17091.1 hypothetical protein CWI40_020780 [Ordospora colligata]TBU19334.1 hypothetical protein CWI42_020760 [Ordospora colligata]
MDLVCGLENALESLEGALEEARCRRELKARINAEKSILKHLMSMSESIMVINHRCLNLRCRSEVLRESSQSEAYDDTVDKQRQKAKERVVALINTIGLRAMNGFRIVLEKHEGADDSNLLKMKYADLRVKHLLLMLKSMSEHDALARVLLVLSQGDLENDIRFRKLVCETVSEVDRFDSLEMAKMSVQFMISRKYVEDIIRLKTDPVIRKYLDRKC